MQKPGKSTDKSNYEDAVIRMSHNRLVSCRQELGHTLLQLPLLQLPLLLLEVLIVRPQ